VSSSASSNKYEDVTENYLAFVVEEVHLPRKNTTILYWKL